MSSTQDQIKTAREYVRIVTDEIRNESYTKQQNELGPIEQKINELSAKLTSPAQKRAVGPDDLLAGTRAFAHESRDVIAVIDNAQNNGYHPSRGRRPKASELDFIGAALAAMILNAQQNGGSRPFMLPDGKSRVFFFRAPVEKKSESDAALGRQIKELREKASRIRKKHEGRMIVLRRLNADVNKTILKDGANANLKEMVASLDAMLAGLRSNKAKGE